MEKQSGFIRKFLIILCIIGICFVGYFMIILPIVNQGEGDPYFKFYEVAVNEITNNTVTQLEDNDVMNIRGLDVKIENGKISRIYFRISQNPEIRTDEFYYKYGSRPGDPSSRKYLVYKGVYYYAVEVIP